MNKAVSWNVDEVGFDVREAAREAARRQGKSLGEWLHGIIADHADDLGVAAAEMTEPQKIDAITSRLERLGARSETRDGFGDRGAVSRRDVWDAGYDWDREPRRHRRDDRAIGAELVLEEAIGAMERRAQRTERRPDKALHSMSELIQHNETRRERERDSISALASHLARIESRLGEQAAPVAQNPIKSALARLETRLDAIGRRTAAEGLARRRAQDAPVRRPADTPGQGYDKADPASLYRLEEKLNAILHSVRSKPDRSPTGASPVAMAAASRAANDRTRLGEAIDEITRHQQSLDERAPALSLRDAILRRTGAPRDAAKPPVTNVNDELSTLASRIEELHRDVLAQNQVRHHPFVDLDTMRGEIAAMAEVLHELASRGRTAAHPPAEAAVPPQALSKIETTIERMAAKIDAVFDGTEAPRVSTVPEAAAIEGLLRDLGRKLEAAQAPGAGREAFDALQSQIADLSARFERSDHGLDQLASLERSMHELFTHLEETRASVETSAQHAAREVLRIAVEEGRAQAETGAATSLATMRALHEAADARTGETLSAVHETLEKVVERLSVMETDLAEVRGRPRIATASTAAVNTAISDASTPRHAAPVDERDRANSEEIALAADPQIGLALAHHAEDSFRSLSIDRGEEERRAGFIAAARRAAKAAQSDPWLAEFKRPSNRTEPESATRAGLIEQSREYVARHKRPVLLSVAALFVVVGTLAVVQRTGLDGFDIQLAGAARPALALRAVDPRPSQTAAMLSPSALPRTAPSIGKAIPGSDPIQTGSIPGAAALGPSDAARAPVPALPVGLETMAKAGDRAAEYVLGAQYAEGRLVPRDFQAAASWYQKAADQGSVPAQYRLASLFEKGLGVARDKSKARHLYLRAAEAGNPRAMHNLAVMLADGDGQPDYNGAATWFRRAAQFGIHDSQYNLAILLARGLGTPQSFIQSYQWFAIAAAQNDVDAGRKRDEVATRLNANDLAIARALAGAFRPRVADAAATEVQPPPGGWDGAAAPSPLNSPRSKISML